MRSLAHGLERLGLALLVGGSLFVFATGVLNIQLWYPFGFSFVPAHYYARVRLPRRAGLPHGDQGRGGARARSASAAWCARCATTSTHTEPEPRLEGRETSAPVERRRRPRMTRRLLLGTVGGARLGLALMGTGQVVGRAAARAGAARAARARARRRAQRLPGEQDLRGGGHHRDEVGPDWRLSCGWAASARRRSRRDELLAMEQVTAELPIACVEGWSTTQTWTGVRLVRAGPDGRRRGGRRGARCGRCSRAGTFRRATLNAGQVREPRSLLALKVNGADLSLDHGFPARMIVPGAARRALHQVGRARWCSRTA